jgi:L-2-hydroxycarboxylate dehydrogenase (NAD+)
MSDMRVKRAELERFCQAAFAKVGMPADQARDSAEVLVAADAKGIASHGVARLWRYVNGITKGVMLPFAAPECVHRTPSSFVLDAKGGIGLSIGKAAMREVIAIAAERGFACASVRDSNHFGIAGYYAEMALPKDMIGIAMTNTAALGVPTNALDVMFGTNPIAVAVPAAEEPPFVLDMATTVVTRGKVETYLREGKRLPLGWAVDASGKVAEDPKALLDDMLYQKGGGLLPLGGVGESLSGYKGYGLSVLVDIMTAITSAGVFGQHVMDSEATSARVCHFFGAVKIDLFRDPASFKADMDRMLRELRATRPAREGGEVLYAGLKEYRIERESDRLGVKVSKAVWSQLSSIAGDLGLALPEAASDAGAGK